MLSFAFAEKKGAFEAVSLEKVESLFNSTKLLWLDFEAPSTEDLSFVKKLVSLHPLTIQSIFRQNKRSKIHEFEDYLFMVLHPVDFDSGKVIPIELDFVFGKNFLFSFHSKPMKVVSHAKNSLSKNSLSFKHFPSDVLYIVLEALVEGMFDVSDRISESADKIEEEILTSKDKKILSRLFRLKRTIMVFRKIVSPQREVFNFLYHHDNSFIDSSKSIYFRDLYDKLMRISEFIDSSRDLVSDSFDAYLSVVSNRLNEVMKFLAIIATVILPMSLVAGFYGMNVRFFEYSVFGEAGTQFFAVFLMAMIAAIMVYWFRRMGWV